MLMRGACGLVFVSPPFGRAISAGRIAARGGAGWRDRVGGPARAGSSAPAGSSNRRGESIDQESCGAILVEVLVGERVSEIDS